MRKLPQNNVSLNFYKRVIQMPVNALFLILLFVFFAGFSEGTPAAETDVEAHQENDKPKTDGENGIERLLKGNDPSYFVWAKDKGEEYGHAEFFLSVQYPILTRIVKQFCGENSDLFFNYNGKYDFYTGSRYSSPVISRKQNPGLMYEYTINNPSSILKSIKTGYFHESNGQSIDTLDKYLTTENAQDYVSRGWDYIPLDLKFEFKNQLVVCFKGRYFLPEQMFSENREDDIFWEPVDKQPEIEEYDGLTAVFTKPVILKLKWFDSVKLSATYRTGYSEFNLSQRYECAFRMLDIPLYILYFKGYGNEISTYHLKSSYVAIGFELW